MKTDPFIEWRSASRKLHKDPRLGNVVAKVGPPNIQFQPDAFSALGKAILSQQLAPKAAASIVKRVCGRGKFPSPKQFREFTPARFKSFGVSRQKASYLTSLADHWAVPHWRRGWGTLTDADLIERLTQVRGVGEWTAQMYLIFSLGRVDVLATGDYGIQRGLMKLFKLSDCPKPKQMESLMQPWEGYRSVASWYLWKGLDRGLLG